MDASWHHQNCTPVYIHTGDTIITGIYLFSMELLYESSIVSATQTHLANRVEAKYMGKYPTTGMSTWDFYEHKY